MNNRVPDNDSNAVVIDGGQNATTVIPIADTGLYAVELAFRAAEGADTAIIVKLTPNDAVEFATRIVKTATTAEEQNQLVSLLLGGFGE